MTRFSRRLALFGALGLGGIAWGQDKKDKKKAGRKGGPAGMQPQERELTAYEAQRTTANFRLTATN